jgi:hypothetical protein
VSVSPKQPTAKPTSGKKKKRTTPGVAHSLDNHKHDHHLARVDVLVVLNAVGAATRNLSVFGEGRLIRNGVSTQAERVVDGGHCGDLLSVDKVHRVVAVSVNDERLSGEQEMSVGGWVQETKKRQNKNQKKQSRTGSGRALPFEAW